MCSSDLDGKSESVTLGLNRWLERTLAADENLCASWLWSHDRWRHQDMPARRLRLESKRNLLAADLASLGDTVDAGDGTWKALGLRLTYQATPRNKFGVFWDETSVCVNCLGSGSSTISRSKGSVVGMPTISNSSRARAARARAALNARTRGP